MKKILLPILLLASGYTLTYGQDKKAFACPMKKGKIIIEHRGFNEGDFEPGAIFEGKGNKVYSCSSGIVKAIDTSHGLISVFIVFKNYFFSYFNFESVNIVKGQTINKGDMIGQIKKGESLFLIASKDDVLIGPETILRCKIVDRYLE